MPIRTTLVTLARTSIVDTSASALSEYAILAGLIAIVLVTALTSIGGTLSSYLKQVANALGGGS